MKLALIVLSVAILLLAWLTTRDDRFSPNRSPRALTMEQARLFNASVPFADDSPQAARPYHFRGSPAARTQAVQCLATAALYEAGDDARGQQAIIQVVLNRLRAHRANTVCGIVYQGAWRRTGCQFSFTCDGSRDRRPQRIGWPGARAAARKALGGYVFSPVGTATHYHADWIVPYWIGSLDKIAIVHGHIFYRPRSG